jgi:hypothetical protein
MTDEQRKLFKFEDDILELIENQLRNDANTLTQSDLQGAVSALVRNVYNAGKEVAEIR